MVVEVVAVGLGSGGGGGGGGGGGRTREWRWWWHLPPGSVGLWRNTEGRPQGDGRRLHSALPSVM